MGRRKRLIPPDRELQQREYKKKQRTQENYKQVEREGEMRRNNEWSRGETQLRNRKQKKVGREDGAYRAEERRRDTLAKMHARRDPEKSSELKFSLWDTLLQVYNNEIKDGPTSICASCGGLWFGKSLRPVSKDFFLDRNCTTEFSDTLLQKPNTDGSFQLCGTCFKSAARKEIPKRHLLNGFGFPVIPDVLRNLTQLEERLVSPRIPFMQIRSFGVYQQKGLRGNVVNIENDLDTCAKVLPRKFEDTSVVQVMLMRRMKYKAPYIYETIRPSVVYEATKELCRSELYKKEGIVLSEEWIRARTETNAKFIAENLPKSSEPMDLGSVSEDEDVDGDENVNPGSDETLVLRDENNVVKIAPGEGKRPMPWLGDLQAEVLSFPSIYGGIPRKFNDKLKVSAVDIARSEARMFDRRAVKPEKILYAAKRLQNQQVADQIQICLRKSKANKLLTAGQLKSEDFIDKLVNHDDGFRCLRQIRLSPAYWQAQEKKVLAMARQVSLPTLFFTASAAETKWGELLSILHQIHHKKIISEKEALTMSFQEKAGLIRNDPCVCALYFDHRFLALLNIILNKPNGAFSPYPLADYYVKTEFAHRGSAHNHSLLWLQDAPIYDREDEDSKEAVIRFIDSLITCRRDGDEDLSELIGLQIHKHTHTCKRRTKDGGFKCRFSLPLPVMPKTTILQPLPVESIHYTSANKNYELIQTNLKTIGRDNTEDIPFIEYIGTLGLSEEQYMLAIRSSIKRDKIFLQRRTCDVYINAYNEKILKAWKANIDVQFVLDPYACVKYCVSYLTKSCTGISRLMRDVEMDLRLGNVTLREKMRKIANKFINSVEISAQEAAYLVLGIPLVNCSRDDVFINTGPPDERVGLLKSMKELERMQDNSFDVYTPGLLEHYADRPLELEDTCLAEFASMYTATKQSTDGSRKYARRTKGRIVRYRRYNEQQDRSNYCREQVMLYVPWRHEMVDLKNQHIEDKFYSSQGVILINRKIIDPNHSRNEVEDLTDRVQADLNQIERYDNHPQNEDPDYETDIVQSSGESRQLKKVDFLMPPKQIPDEDYLRIARNLNEKQRRYFLHIVHKLRTGITPFHEFIAGGAGVGKSFLISAIVQHLLRRYSTRFGVSLESLPVLVCAPTGKAAFNVGGVTVHCAFRLPPNEYNGQLAPLPEDLCNSLRVKLSNLELVIIDEVSMLSLAKLYQIDARLRQVFQTETVFGGISLLMIGDFYQIRPIMAQFVFETPRNMPFGFIIGNELWSLFKMYELTQIMRQNKALAFAQALNSMARGQMTREDIALFRPREVDNALSVPDDAIHLFCTNTECAEHNLSVQEALHTESALSYAQDTIQGTISETQRQEFSTYVCTLNAADADGLANVVRLQVGAEYMVSSNVDVSDGIFNGSNGRLEHIGYSTTADGQRIPSTAYIKFESPMVGADARRVHTYPNGVDSTWTPIRLLTKQLNKVGYNQGLTVTRRQLPLLPANGITIVKSQGSSYRHLVVHMHKNMRRDLLYVACSRAFHPDGLFIIGEFRPPAAPSQYILDEIARLRGDPLQLSLHFLEDIPSTHNKIMYHNVQSLHKHYADIINDVGYLAAEFMCLLEPWTFQNETYGFPGFIDTKRQDCQGIRSSYGSFLTARVPIENYGFSHSKSGPTSHFSFTIWTIGKVICVMVYKCPGSSTAEFYQSLEDKLKEVGEEFGLVFGDLNIDIKVDKNLLLLFEKYGYRLLVPFCTPSTDGGTQTDLAFGNFSSIDAWYYEAVFSYHSPICITWPKDQELTRIDFGGLQQQMAHLDIRTTAPDTNSCTEVMDTEEHNGELNLLPPITEQTARCRHWRIGGHDLSLNELKTLEHSLTPSDINILRKVAAEDHEDFQPQYLTDQVVDMLLEIATAGTNSQYVSTAVVQLATRGGMELKADSLSWNTLDNVFIPIHEGVHWSLLVVQPQSNRILFLDPNANTYIPSSVRLVLLPQISRVLGLQNLAIVTPEKSNQEDAWNCGVFILKYTEQILRNEPLQFEFDANIYREELINRLWVNSEEYLDTLQ